MKEKSFDLEKIIDREIISYDISGYFPEKQVDKAPLAVIKPKNYEEVREIIRFLNERGIPVFTSYEKYFDPSNDYSEGVILDFSNLKAVDRFDARNLIVHLGRGVTFKELLKIADEEGVNLFLPFSTPTRSVAECYTMRYPVKESARYPDYNISNLYIVLPDGRLHKTGEHSISEEAGDCRDDPGPNISRWYFGSPDIMGVMVRASIYLYPKWERREGIVWKLKGEDDLGEILKNIPRHELTVECFSGDAKSLKELTGLNLEDGNYIFTGFSGREKLVNYCKKKVKEIIKNHEAEIVAEIEGEKYAGKFIEAEGSVRVIYSSFSSFREKFNFTKNWMRDERGLVLRYIISSFSRGGCFSCTYWIENMWGGKVEKLLEDAEWAYPGVFFRNSKKFFTPQTENFLKKVLNITDKKSILNPQNKIPGG